MVRTIAAIALCVLSVLTVNLGGACPVNLVGFMHDRGSVATHTTSFIDTLHDVVPLKLFKTMPCSFDGFPGYYNHIARTSVDLSNLHRIRRMQSLSGITIFTDFILNAGWHLYRSLPNKSTLRFAYSNTECTALPAEWLKRLNNGFDAIIVTDDWVAEIFKQAGVKAPIFTLPLVLNLDRLLAKQEKKIKPAPFVFGFSGTFIPRKNVLTLVRAFVEEFGAYDDVKLIVHARFDWETRAFFEEFEKIKTDNVTVLQQCFSRQEYEDFIASLACYVTVSKGEGFSIVPREALAAAVPCIVSNNTAQHTICNTGFVRAIPAHIVEPSQCFVTGKVCGYDFGCAVADVRAALRDVYQNYDYYCTQAVQGREWVKGYTIQGLKQRYQMLVKPKKVILGACNQVTEEYLMTDSPALFEKYKQLFDLSGAVFSVQT